MPRTCFHYKQKNDFPNISFYQNTGKWTLRDNKRLILFLYQMQNNGSRTIEINSEINTHDALQNTKWSSPALRVLVVDDDEQYNEQVAEIVELLGHTVVGRAFDGENAVRMIAAKPESIDVVVMDVVMPLQNGILAAEKMLLIAPGIKILLMSGDWTNKSLVPNVESIRFLRKPFGKEEMRIGFEGWKGRENKIIE
jgi:CheY-like chemotaxis protein